MFTFIPRPSIIIHRALKPVQPIQSSLFPLRRPAMSTSTPTNKIPTLLIGLSPGHPSGPTFPLVRTGDMKPEELPGMLKRMGEMVAESPYSTTPLLITDENDFPKIIEKLKEQEWKAIVIGFGVRGHPDCTVLFESLITLTRKHAPNAALGFNSTPLDTVEALRRVCPVPVDE